MMNWYKRELREKKDAISAVLEWLECGLAFHLSEYQYRNWDKWLSAMDFPIVTKQKLERGGFQLKDGEQPCGYFTRKRGDKVTEVALYVLRIQAYKSESWDDLLDSGKALSCFQWVRDLEYVWPRK